MAKLGRPRKGKAKQGNERRVYLTDQEDRDLEKMRQELSPEMKQPAFLRSLLKIAIKNFAIAVDPKNQEAE